MKTAFVLPLDAPRSTLETVGGEGASLSRLVRTGLPVPGGFHVTTETYCRFVATMPGLVVGARLSQLTAEL